MATTIQVSSDLVEELRNRKMYDKESYEEVIWDLLEDSMEISNETKRLLKIAEKEAKEGKTHKLKDIEKEFNL
jgi:hypothetical protein